VLQLKRDYEIEKTRKGLELNMEEFNLGIRDSSQSDQVQAFQESYNARILRNGKVKKERGKGV